MMNRMKVFAADSVEAMAKITRELGGDARIYSTRRVNGGIEIIATGFVVSFVVALLSIKFFLGYIRTHLHPVRHIPDCHCTAVPLRRPCIVG